MGERIRAFDWSRTAIGPPRGWSPALRVMLRSLLVNGFPHILWWGPHYIQFYNDAARSILGAKHPEQALGRPANRCWAEIWPAIGALIDRPFNGGPASFDDDLPLQINRNGFIEEVHFTIAFSPVPDEQVAGGTGGVLASIHEITPKEVGRCDDVKRAAAALAERDVDGSRHLSLIVRQSKVMNGINKILSQALSADSEAQLGEVCLAVAEEVTGSRFGFIGEINAQGRLDDIAISDPGWEACRMQDGAGHCVIANGLTVHGLYGRVVREGKGFYTNEPARHPDSIGIPEGHPPLNAFMGAPLVRGETAMGVIALGNRPGGYTDEQLQDLEALAPAVVQAFSRKRAEQALRESQVKFKTLVESSPDIIARLDRDHRHLFVSPAIKQAIGIEPEQLLGKTNRELGMPPELCRLWDEKLDEVFASGRAANVEFAFPSPSGPRRYSALLVPESPGGGRVQSVLGITRDVTDRRRAEEQIATLLSEVQRERDRLSALFSNMSDEVWFADKEKQIALVNPAAFKEFALAPGQTAAMEKIVATLEILRPDGSPRPVEETPILRALAGEVIRNQEEIIRTPASGQRRYRQVNAAPVRDVDGQILGAVAVVRDITESKHAEQERERLLRAVDEVRQRFEAVVQNSPLGICVWRGPDLVYELVNPAYRVFAPGKKFLGKRYAEVWPEALEPYMSIILRVLETGETYHAADLSAEIRRTPDGPLETVFFNFYLVALPPDASGQAGVLNIAFETTEHVRAARAEREGKERLEALFNATSHVFYQMNPDWSEMRFLSGGGVLAETPMPSRAWLEKYIDPLDQARVKAAIAKAIRTKGIYELEHRVRMADQSQGWTLSRAVPLLDSEGQIREWFGAASDITERKRAEEALWQLNETLEAEVAERTALAEARTRQLQALAIELIEAEERERQRFADLLHDDLQQMLASARLQLQSAGGDRPVVAQVTQILQDAIEKSRRLSHELSPPVLHRGTLYAAFQWLADQMRERFGFDVELQADAEMPHLEKGPLKVFIFRAVQELLFNAVKHSGVKHARVRLSGHDSFCSVTVSDGGKGFETRVLDPTKVKMGFGLFTIAERARHIGGQLSIDSEPGKGSRFSLSVPVQQPPAEKVIAATQLPAQVAPVGFPSGAEGLRVLFADDHKVMRQGLIRLIALQPDIQVAGEAENGREALALARQLQPDVIVMDISMPEMDGIEATRHIKAELPEVRVIGLSMYEDERISRMMCDAGAEMLISKTASSTELLKAIYGPHP